MIGRHAHGWSRPHGRISWRKSDPRQPGKAHVGERQARFQPSGDADAAVDQPRSARRPRNANAVKLGPLRNFVASPGRNLIEKDQRRAPTKSATVGGWQRSLVEKLAGIFAEVAVECNGLLA
jgi:hypothetical protein